MKAKIACTLFLLCVALGGGAVFAADQPAQLEANKKLALDFWREVIEAHNVAAASKYYAVDLIQHNRQVGQGLAGFQQTFGAYWKEPLPVQPTMKNPPITVTAEGDLVTLVFKLMVPDEADKTKTHEIFEFDMFRVKGGKIVEHWDSAP
jgi:predicted SnoaL-like aldol condensation-catalyzing enzyme